jgi:hypothetical protein
MKKSMSGLRRRVLAGLVAVSLAAVGIVAVTEGSAGAQITPFSSVPIASDRVDGIGLAVLQVGNVVYVGGTFSNVYNQANQLVAPRANLAAFDRTTGHLLTTFRADANGAVRSFATDGSRLYVGGSFTTIGGQSRGRVAALNLATGAVDPTFHPGTNSNVYGVAYANGRLFLAGSFSTVGTATRSRLAAVSTSDGSVDGQFLPSANNTVASIAAQPDGSHVYVGGNFTGINNTGNKWLVGLNGATGVIDRTFSGVEGGALAIAPVPGGQAIVAAIDGAGNQGGYWRLSDGTRRWYQRCDGDGQAVAVTDQTMLWGHHDTCGTDVNNRANALDLANNGARDVNFDPQFDKFFGVYGLNAQSDMVAAAGDFTNISGVSVQGFALFPAVGPPPATTTTIPTTTAPPGTGVNIPMGSTWSYLDGGAVAASGWNNTGFDDSTWKSGPGQLGFGDGDEATIVSYGPDPNHKAITTYFRKTFGISSVPSNLAIDLIDDDGAVVYVNGVEVLRENMPTGTITPTTFASTDKTTTENDIHSFVVPASALVAGTNVVAVEIHQNWSASSDLSFDLGMTGI